MAESSRRGLFRTAAEAAVRAALPADPPPPPADDLDRVRYARQLVLDGWGEVQQRRLQDASVLVVGAGALGSPVVSYLTGAGIGRLGILDGDLVDLSNLHRQHLHWTPQIGRPKVHSAVEKLQLLNPDVMIEPYQVRLDADNAEGLVLGHDLVVDCSDNFETRYVVNAACCESGTWLVEGGVLGLAGMVMSIRPGSSACYRCVFPAPPADCAAAGVLGPVPGVVGSLMALEAMKLLAGLDGALLDAFLQIDVASGDFLRVATSRRPGCADCG
jgi:molybdopterin/thiamine biosynthesis adenylyltransferase